MLSLGLFRVQGFGFRVSGLGSGVLVLCGLECWPRGDSGPRLEPHCEIARS